MTDAAGLVIQLHHVIIGAGGLITLVLGIWWRIEKRIENYATERANTQFRLNAIEKWQTEHKAECRMDHAALRDAVETLALKLEAWKDSMRKESEDRARMLHERLNDLISK